MIVVADSGSTKCDWALVKDNGEVLTIFSTMGFNPYFHTKELISSELFKNRGHFPPIKTIEKVFFYGAGCSSPEKNQIIQQGLKLFFTGSQVQVDHDLKGAAYASFSGEPGIVCILGTGSNSCFFDGKSIYEEVPSLSYILGDEGSGSYFGKRLLRAYLYKHLPEELKKEFEKEYTLDKDKIFDQVYNSNRANVFLASFMKFISQHQDHPFFQQMLFDGLSVFVEIHVKCYKDSNKIPIHFVGSVAYYCKKILVKVCKSKGVKFGSILKKPIDGLIQYHWKMSRQD